MSELAKLNRFKENVEVKYQIYNSIFMTLPFRQIVETGGLLPLFHESCRKGFENGDDPLTIVQTFFKKYLSSPTKKSEWDLLFRFIQYIERQVVLFDAIEDAAFPMINNMQGIGSLSSLKELATLSNKLEDLKEHLQKFKVRIVLTAHPTQFYPSSVLGIITDLGLLIKENNFPEITKLMIQLGKTPFLKNKKPTPYDEAVSLIWYLENIFYKSFSKIFDYIQKNIFEGQALENDIINIGFWPGGDRDGNPFVTPEITLQVARKLKESLLKNYYREIKFLKRRITFTGLEDRITKVGEQVNKSILDKKYFNKLKLEALKNELIEIRDIIVEEHESLYVDEINSLLNKIQLFGLHFATLDIRQDSRVHDEVFQKVVYHLNKRASTVFPKNYLKLSPAEQVNLLSNISGKLDIGIFKDELVLKTLKTLKVIKTIQDSNGEKACHRYIISNNESALNVMQVFALLKLVAFPIKLPIDIIPLFETIVDLENAYGIMEELYKNFAYRKHLKKRDNKQTIMLGFSDGTKDGGYLMANWAIFKAKEKLTVVSKKFGITVIFFDGRGGPPARGGGKTHQFYASLGSTIEDREVQLTIQGQTISSNFGTLESSQYNLEQLMTSGISNKLKEKSLENSEKNNRVMDDLARISYKVYLNFRNHPKFIPYLENISPLKYYSKTNIGSRPAKRGSSTKFNFSDLRAIPFVGSWNQLKQNIPGFFGVGTALKHYEISGKFGEVKNLYQQSVFFKTLIENSMMALSKSFFELTSYLAKDREYGEFWEIIHEEYETTKRLILKMTGYRELMENEPARRASIRARESIILPLLTVQQYALKRLQELKKNDSNKTKGKIEVEKKAEEIKVFEKIVTRSLFGNINASRNSA